MKETIENLDFNTLDENGTTEFINSLLQLNDTELKEAVLVLIDKTNLSELSDGNIPKSYETIFGTEVVKSVAENLLEELSDE